MKIIVEGIDRLGKDTLINGIINQFGYHHVIHYSSPKFCDYYKNDIVNFKDNNEKQLFQSESFFQGFELLERNVNLIMNRFHLGEYVYAPRYRGYYGDYVFEMEQQYPKALSETILILLHTSNIYIMDDDGKSHDFDKRGEEQDSFLTAFNLSAIQNKFKFDVYDKWTDFYKPKEVILKDVLLKIESVVSHHYSHHQ